MKFNVPAYAQKLPLLVPLISYNLFLHCEYDALVLRLRRTVGIDTHISKCRFNYAKRASDTGSAYLFFTQERAACDAWIFESKRESRSLSSFRV